MRRTSTSLAPKISLAGLMVLTLLVAVSMAMLREPPSVLWASSVFTATLLTLAAATVGAMYRRSPAWSGFVVFGWVCLAAAFGPWRESDAVPVPPLLSTVVLKKVSHHFYGRAICPVTAGHARA